MHVPKTAGTSIRRTLAQVGVQDRPQSKPAGRKFPPSEFSKHTSAEAYRRYYGPVYATAETFAVIRNPFEWLWSFFRFIKFTNISPDTGKPWRHQIYKQVSPLDFPGFVDFVCLNDGFYRLSCSKKLREVGIPYFTQAAFVSDPEKRIIVNSIFKFENLREDLPAWLSKKGLPVQGLETINVSRKLDSKDIYTAKMKSRVENRFSTDFEVWSRL